MSHTAPRLSCLGLLTLATACAAAPAGPGDGESSAADGRDTPASSATAGSDSTGAASAPDAAASAHDGPGPASGDSRAPALKGGDHIYLMTQDKRQYVQVASGGAGAVTADGAAAGATEQLALTDLTSAELTDGDEVTIAASSGEYWSAAGGGGGDLTATATSAGIDETFIVHRIAGHGVIHTGDLVSVETKENVNYVSAIEGGGGAVAANAPWARGWESFWITIAGQPAPVNKARKKVLDYLASIQGSATVAGQHNKNNPTPMDATDEVTGITGVAPGYWSADFGFGKGDVAARPTMIAQAQKEWAAGSIVHLMYHACVPTRNEDCSWDDIGGSHPAKLTDTQWSDLVTDGGTLNAAWKSRLDKLSVFFAELKKAGVAPLFRPEHEMNQGVFWWGGRSGAGGTSRLFQITHDYLVGNKGFDNIVWVWDLQDFSSLSSDVTGYFPGADYYDVAALDVYDGGYDTSKYTTMRGAAGGKPIALGECSTLPTAAQLSQQPDWVFVMLWPDFISQNQAALPALYSAPNVVTLPRMPGW